LILFVLEAVKPGLRGELKRWMLEVKAGVFVGSLSARVRDMLWARIREAVFTAQVTEDHYVGAWMIRPANNEQGFLLESVGDTGRRAVDFDGLTLILERR